AASNPNTVYASTLGHVFVTTNHGATWAQHDPVPGTVWFFDILVDPRDNRVAYVTGANYSELSGVGRVWRTSDGGITWTDITSNLPDYPAYGLALDPVTNILYVGLENGAYFSTNFGQSWARLGQGLPNVLTRVLTIDPTDGIMAAATWGRGVWELQLWRPIPTHYNVIAPTSVTAGTPFSLTVNALDD